MVDLSIVCHESGWDQPFFVGSGHHGKKRPSFFSLANTKKGLWDLEKWNSSCPSHMFHHSFRGKLIDTYLLAHPTEWDFCRVNPLITGIKLTKWDEPPSYDSIMPSTTFVGFPKFPLWPETTFFRGTEIWPLLQRLQLLTSTRGRFDLQKWLQPLFCMRIIFRENVGMGQNPGTAGEPRNSWVKMDVNNPLKCIYRYWPIPMYEMMWFSYIIVRNPQVALAMF